MWLREEGGEKSVPNQGVREDLDKKGGENHGRKDNVEEFTDADILVGAVSGRPKIKGSCHYSSLMIREQ